MPNVDDGLLDYLRRTHDFDAWSAGGDETRQVPAGFTFEVAELPGFELVRTRHVTTSGVSCADSIVRELESNQAPGKEQREVLLRLQVYELSSVRAARAQLLQLLAEFQTAAITRRTDLNVGDVAFGRETALLFARANLVVWLRNAGRTVLSVLPTARAIDAAVVGRASRAP